MLIMVGEDINEESVEILARSEDGKSFEPKQLSLSNAVEECLMQTVGTISTRGSNPLWHFMYAMTGKCYAFTNLEKHSNLNCAALRAKIGAYVRKRMSQYQANDKLEDKHDILTLFLQSPDIFTEEVIIDELCDFLIAGTQTTYLTTQTVLSHFALDPQSVSRVRKEF